MRCGDASFVRTTPCERLRATTSLYFLTCQVPHRQIRPGSQLMLIASFVSLVERKMVLVRVRAQAEILFQK